MHRSILRRILLLVISIGWWGSVGITDSQGQTCRNNYVCTADPNTVSADYATVGGGRRNTASGFDAMVGGGFGNTASGAYATVGGGGSNNATGEDATVSGGFGNTAISAESTVGGGFLNDSIAMFATVGGGELNTASGSAATVGGGFKNTAQGERAMVGGGVANFALGFAAAIPGGYNNRAGGNFSFAAGRQAQARHTGSFVWADANTMTFPSTNLNQFNVRASGGTRIFSNAAATVGVRLAPGSNAWSIASDRALKEDFQPVDKQEVLANVRQLTIQNWKLKEEEGNVRHIGPVAQDFHAAFGLGSDERFIHTGDAVGVSLVAIQALAERNQALEQQLEELQRQNNQSQQQNAEFQRQNTVLQMQMNHVVHQVEALVQERENGQQQEVVLAE